ncbi:MAG: PIN domain-containing protein [Pseudohongiella sp.]|nr:PIN domain-containing protein [Pseudohongiella sp.]
MRSQFPGYFRPKDDQLKALWQNCVFAVDANVLLNLYRYSSATRKELEGALSTVGDRIHIPHHAAKEFLKNRLTVTSAQGNEYTKTIATIQELLETLSSKDRHPFLSEDQLPEFQKYSKTLIENLKAQQHGLLNTADDDQILLFIEKLFEQKTGSPFDEKTLEALANEGEARYAKETPPGYKDGKKDGSGDIYRKYGDLIIWKQLIEHSRSEKKPLIFITDDRKEDWWLQQSGKTIGPRPELIEEFLNETKQPLWMYSVERFIQESARQSKTTVSDDVIDEIVKVSIESKQDHLFTSSITVSQDAYEASPVLNFGILVVTLSKSMRYATGTGKFSPILSRVPDFSVDLIDMPDHDIENIGISFGCGTIKNFNVHLKAKHGELVPGDYVVLYMAIAKLDSQSP